MSSMIKKRIPTPPEQQEPYTESSPDVKAAAEAEALRLKRLKGFQSSIHTGPLGVAGEAVGKKETLG